MNRSAPLRQKASLKRTSAPQRRRKPVSHEPGRDAYKTVVWGFCAVCGTEGRVRRHHVVREQDVRRLGGDPWALDNSLWVGVETLCGCHGAHHSRSHPIPLPLVPDDAWLFAVRLFGSVDRTLDYFGRFYAPEVPEGEQEWQP